MPVHAAPIGRFRVVEMKRLQPFQADNRVKPRKDSLAIRRRAHIVTGSEDVTRVKTDTEPRRIPRHRNHIAQVFKTVAEVCPLPGGSLK